MKAGLIGIMFNFRYAMNHDSLLGGMHSKKPGS